MEFTMDSIGSTLTIYGLFHKIENNWHPAGILRASAKRLLHGGTTGWHRSEIAENQKSVEEQSGVRKEEAAK